MSASRTLLGMIAAYPYRSVWNMTGQPACSVPAPMLSRAGLPLGVQLVAPPDGEGVLLALAAQLERCIDCGIALRIFNRSHSLTSNRSKGDLCSVGTAGIPKRRQCREMCPMWRRIG